MPGGGQHGRIDGHAQRALLRRHVERDARGTGIDRCGKVKQIVAAENRRIGLNEGIGQIDILGRCETMQPHLRKIILPDHRVGEPLAVGREIHPEVEPARRRVDQGDGIGREIDCVKMQMIVFKHGAAAVRRPAQQREVAHLSQRYAVMGFSSPAASRSSSACVPPSSLK